MKQKTLLFILLLTNFFLTKNLTSQTDGDAFFSSPIVHEIYLNFSQPNYWDSLVANKPLDIYMEGDVIIDGTTYSSVGVKFKGNSSYSNPSDKKPFKVDMNTYVSGQNVDGLKKFNLNNGFKDPSFLREKLALDFYNEHGLNAPRCAYAKLYLNGSYWGLYLFVEEVDKNWLDDDNHFNNKEGNLFKGDPSGDLKWINSTPSSYYTKYELHTNETVNDWTDLVELINKINNSGTYFHDSLETILNTESFIKQWAAVNLFVNLDSYIGSGHNYFMYHDTLSGKFEWIAWDVNESFGNFNMGMTPTQLQQLSLFYSSLPTSSRPLVEKMLLDNTYKNTLITTVCQWLAYDFSNDALDNKIDSLANAIRPAVYADTKKFYSSADFETNLTSDITYTGGPGSGTIMGIKSFITARRNALTTELAANGCNVGIAEQSKTNENAFIYPNPANDLLQINFYTPGKHRIELFYITGQLVQQTETNDSKSALPVDGLAAGSYFLVIDKNEYHKLEVVH